MRTTNKPMFCNGTEFLDWYSVNCERCIKATWWNPKTNSYPIFRCSIQRDIEMQAAGIDKVSLRSYNATRNIDCPYRKTERKVYIRRKKSKKDENQKSLF